MRQLGPDYVLKGVKIAVSSSSTYRPQLNLLGNWKEWRRDGLKETAKGREGKGGVLVLVARKVTEMG